MPTRKKSRPRPKPAAKRTASPAAPAKVNRITRAKSELRNHYTFELGRLQHLKDVAKRKTDKRKLQIKISEIKRKLTAI